MLEWLVLFFTFHYYYYINFFFALNLNNKKKQQDKVKKTVVEKYLADSEEVIYDLDGNVISDNECLLSVSEREYTSPASWSQHSDTVGLESKPFIIQSVDENQEIEVYTMEEITGKAKIGSKEK